MQKTREYNPNLCEIAGFSVARFSRIVYAISVCNPLFCGRWTSSIGFCRIRGVLKYTIHRVQNTRQLWQAVCCSFDKHGSILIIFGQHHQQSFKNNMHI